MRIKGVLQGIRVWGCVEKTGGRRLRCKDVRGRGTKFPGDGDGGSAVGRRVYRNTRIAPCCLGTAKPC